MKKGTEAQKPHSDYHIAAACWYALIINIFILR